MKKNIVVIGPVFVDVKGYPIDKYLPGERNSGNVEYVHGGVSRNIAEDIVNSGIGSTFISLVDDNALGNDVKNYLNRIGVNTNFIESVNDGMGTWLAVFDETGDVVASISKRPDMSKVLDILNEKGDEIISNCDGISLEIDLNEDIDRKIFELAEKYNKPVFAVVSNMSIAKERKSLLNKVECIVCNVSEMGILFNANFEKLKAKDLANVLLGRIKELSIRSMVVTMGGKGSVYATLSGEKGFVPSNKVNVVDTTGAGDAFFSGIVIGRTLGKNIEKSCKIGAFLASEVIQTTTNFCKRRDIRNMEI